MSGFFKISGLACLALFAVSEASAKPVHISGTHSRSEIAQKCAASGGVGANTQGKSGGYGCWNVDKDSWVDCDAHGHCTGNTVH
ncbi:MAG TPA: hypothetical protein VHB74_09125 [Devosia sp.]|nr:hypothetical protein [Devosia sp.]